MNKIKKINSGVVNGKVAHKIFSIAKQYRFALPAINCINIESINAALEAAAKVKSPIIIQFSYGGSEFISGKGLKTKKFVAAIEGAISGAYHVHRISKLYKIPVILHTDHCSKSLLPWIDGLLAEGKSFFLKTGQPLFTSHMLDLSHQDINENIDICCTYLKKISEINMSLEIELGCTGGEEDGVDNSNLNIENLYTNPKDVFFAWQELNKISKNFNIAASFGNVHGVYQHGNVKLNPKILKNSQEYICKKYNLKKNNIVNFVFHGGSGSSEKDIKESINYGVVKINFDTDIQWSTWLGILEFYKKNKLYLNSQLGNPYGKNQPNKKFYDPRVWLRCAQVKVVNSIKKMFILLNAHDLI